MRLYLQYFKMNLRSQMEYRTSFIMLLAGQMIYPVMAFLGVYFLMRRFGDIGGWTMQEVAFGYGSIMVSYSLAEAFGRGFDTFSRMIRNGTFDRVLLRPRATALQVLGSAFELNRIGKIATSLAIYIYGINGMDIIWAWDKVLVAAAMLLAGVAVFCGIFILYAVICFWTIEGTEIMHILTDGTRELARFPLDVYDSRIIRFFIFVVPIASANFLPLMYITGKAAQDAWMYAWSPALAFVFLLPCFFLWEFGVRHYKSTGS